MIGANLVSMFDEFWVLGSNYGRQDVNNYILVEITIYSRVVWSKFNLSTCDLKFDILPI